MQVIEIPEEKEKILKKNNGQKFSNIDCRQQITCPKTQKTARKKSEKIK